MDLEGLGYRPLGVGSIGQYVPGLPAAANDVKREKIKEIAADAATYLLKLRMSGQAEAVTEQRLLTSVANSLQRGRKARQGVQSRCFIRTMAFATYGNAVITRDKRVLDNPDLARRFTEASLKRARLLTGAL